LHLAAISDTSGEDGAAAMVQCLLSLGADATQTCGVGGAPILHYSVTTGNPDACRVIEHLLHSGASALTEYEDLSALEMAAGAAAAMVSDYMYVFVILQKHSPY